MTAGDSRGEETKTQDQDGGDACYALLSPREDGVDSVHCLWGGNIDDLPPAASGGELLVVVMMVVMVEEEEVEEEGDLDARGAR